MCLIFEETVDSQGRNLHGGVLSFKVCLKSPVCCQHVLVIFHSLPLFVSLEFLKFLGKTYCQFSVSSS